MTERWYDFETETGRELVCPRINFRNMRGGIGSLMGFSLKPVELNDLYKHPFDIYSFKDAEIIVMGGDAHCHTEEKLAKYKDSIAFFCDEKDKEKVIKEIEKNL